MIWEVAGGTKNLPTVLALQVSGTEFDCNPFILKMGMAMSAFKPSGVEVERQRSLELYGQPP